MAEVTCKTCPWFEGGAMEGPSCRNPESPYFPWHIDFDESCFCALHPAAMIRNPLLARAEEGSEHE